MTSTDGDTLYFDDNLDSAYRADKSYKLQNIHNFIPIACHYDANTLLTKNGELIQTIHIHGLNSEKISKKLFDLRNILRQSLKHNVQGYSFGIWVHTIRSKTDLDAFLLPYPNFFASEVHSLWNKKNFWSDKYVNHLYVSIVHKAAEFKIKNINGFINSLSKKIFINFHNEYLSVIVKSLNKVTEGVLSELKEFGANRISVFAREGKYYSGHLAFYQQIINLKKNPIPLPMSDLSQVLGNCEYTVSDNRINVVDQDNQSRFAAILSLKEYNEIPSYALDQLLQLPMQLVCSEVFYLVNKERATKPFEYSKYILEISKDQDLKDIKGLDKIFDSEPNQHCLQQLHFTIISNSAKELEQQISKASESLSDLGLVHVREDTFLEHIFWSQLPGNFAFLKRLNPTITSNTSAFASLHNFPTGNINSPWGQYLTILRTEKGTPYFINLHNNAGSGHTCIIGQKLCGKTVTANFLVSEAMKFMPIVLHISNNRSSELFVNALGGLCLHNPVNPFKLSKLSILEFLKTIVFGYESTDINDSNLSTLATTLKTKRKECEILLEKIANKIADTNDLPIAEILESMLNDPIENKPQKASNAKKSKATAEVKNIFMSEEVLQVNSDPIKEAIKNRLLFLYSEKSIYGYLLNSNIAFNSSDGGFDLEDIDLKKNFKHNDILGLMFEGFNEADFRSKYYPDEDKLIPKYNADLMLHKKVCSAYMLAIIREFASLNNDRPKIIVLDDFLDLIQQNIAGDFFSEIMPKLTQNNCIIISTINLTKYEEYKNIWDSWLAAVDNKIILGLDNIVQGNLSAALKLNIQGVNKLKSLPNVSRLFLFEQEKQMIVLELSLGAFPKLLGVFSCKPADLTIYEEAIKKFGSEPEDWLSEVYNKLK